MLKSFSSPTLKTHARWALLLVLVLRPWVCEASTLVIAQDYCRGAKGSRVISMFYHEKIPRVPIGTPLDVALRNEQREVARIRGEAQAAFLIRPPQPLARAMEQYTFLTPESEKDSYGLGGLVAVSEISAALKYRKILWRHFIEQSTTVREAVSENPHDLRFQVSLDLSYFCRYRQRIADLVTQR
jgi:hypothetical protein